MERLIKSKTYDEALRYLKDKDYTSAIVHFSEALEEDYIDPEIHYYLALCYGDCFRRPWLVELGQDHHVRIPTPSQPGGSG